MAKESGGKVHAVSRSGAAGPLQFMYSTGARFGLGMVDGFDQRFDPAASARANAAYMDEQLKVFNDNLELTLAAYNGGEGRMRRTVVDDTSVSFYDPQIYFKLPAETRDYVPMVLAAAWLFLHPDSYNLKFPAYRRHAGIDHAQASGLAVRADRVPGRGRGKRDRLVSHPAQPQSAAEPGSHPAGRHRIAGAEVVGKMYATRCVDGHWPILAHDLHAAAMPTAQPPAPLICVRKSKNYRVRRGDTLSSIVRKLGCSSVEGGGG